MKTSSTRPIVCKSNSDLVLKTSLIMGELRDHVNNELDELEKEIQEIINQTIPESKIKKERCWICNSKEDSSNKEQNHVAGRKHDYKMVTLCIPCHREFTRMQLSWDARWWSTNQPENIQNAFLLLGIRDMLILKTKKTGNSLYEQYGLRFNQIISQFLKGVK